MYVNMRGLIGVLVLLCLTITYQAHGRMLLQRCPPASLDSVANLDLQKYIAAPWYSLAQVEVTFQRANEFYCVRARYIAEDPNNITKGINVINYANRDRVNGPSIGTSGAAGNTSFYQFARVAPTRGPSATSKLLVGPKQLLLSVPVEVLAQQFRAPNGNYIIVAVGPSKDPNLGYEWAIIVGGSQTPSEPTGNGLCGPSETRDEGLWLFHRNPVAPASDLKLIKTKAQELGIDTSRLLPVEQKGCKYIGADPGSTKTP